MRNTQYKSFANQMARTSMLKEIGQCLENLCNEKQDQSNRRPEAFKRYISSFSLVNEPYTGERAFSYIQFQKNQFRHVLTFFSIQQMI